MNLVLVCGPALGLYLLCHDLPLLFLSSRRLLLHLDELCVPLSVFFVLICLPGSCQLVVILGQLCLGLGILLHGLALLFPPHPFQFLQWATFFDEQKPAHV